MKHNLLFIGFLFVAGAAFVPFSFTESGEASFVVDVLPDFLGFVLIFLGMERLTYSNKLLYNCRSFATVFAVLTLLTFIGQLSPMILLAVNNGVFAFILNLLNAVYTKLEYILLAIYMVFIALFCLGSAKELSVRTPYAEKRKEFSRKDEYSELHFSKKAHVLHKLLAYVFAIAYIVGAAAYVICFFFDTRLTVFGIETGIWPVFIPLHVLLLICFNTQLRMICADRPEELVAATEETKE